MQDLWLKFKKVKKSIGGNREKRHFEFTFGQPQEEQWGITPPNKWNKRIIAQLEFALVLTEEQSSPIKAEFEGAISAALDFLLTRLESDGVLTNEACQRAEEMLLPLGKAAKEYGLILSAHAHIDMNWMWGWQETVAVTRDTFRTMLNLMDEYPDFCFSQSQASVYKIIEDFDPEMMDQIKKRIKEGRWEVTATAWVETDKNMPATESLLRHIKYTREYLRENWEIDPDSLEVDFSPDTFGHSANVPEINSYGNVKYYYHCRGLDGSEVLFRWKAPSGKEVLVYREQAWYNGSVTEAMAPGLIDISRRCGGLKTGLVVYGVGDHGGGATRRDIENALEMMEYPIYPKIKFGTLREYFKLAEAVRDKLNVIDKELNYIFPGCYTTQSRIKLGNRKNEKALLEAETYSSLSKAHAGSVYQYRQFERAWQNVLFSHFHDILTGSCVQESREHAMGLFAESMAVANTQHSNALRVLAENIDTSGIKTDEETKSSQSEGAGVGFGMTGYTGVPNPERGKGKTRIFHVFNSMPFERTQNVEITVWDWPGDMRYLAIEDTNGQKIEFARIDSNMQDYWSHKYFRILARVRVAALGYATIVLSEEQKNEYPHYFNDHKRSDHAYSNYVLENDYIRAEFDSKSGYMISLIDKESGDEAVMCQKSAGLQFVQTEKATSNAWNIGHYLKIEPIDNIVRIHFVGTGLLKTGFYVERKIYGSTIKETVSLAKDARALEYKLNIDWNETAGPNFVPVLHYNFPLTYKADDYIYDVPAGAQKRPKMHLDVPGLCYGAAINPDSTKKSLVISSDCKYGYRAYEDNLSATLINSANSPDPYPERGIHEITLYVGFEQACPKKLADYALALLRPFDYVPANVHPGCLPLENSLMSFCGETAVLSAVTTSADGGLLVRFFEACGKECEVSIELGSLAKSAHMVDLMENELAGCEIKNGKITAKIAPYSIGAVKIKT